MRPPARSTRWSRPLANEEGSTITQPDSPRGLTPLTDTTMPASRKLKKPRHRMTDRQLECLEALFRQGTHPSRQDKQELANEVGMEIRTVTVWFQNRRQLSKKQSSVTIPPPAPRQPLDDTSVKTRRPLATVTHRNLPTQSEYHDPISPLSLSPEPHHLPAETYSFSRQHIPPHELWKHLPSSSAATSRAVSRAVTPVSSCTGPPENISYGAGDFLQKSGGKRKRMLEWACARLEKRKCMQPANFDLEDVDLGDITEDDTDSTADVDIEDIQHDPQSGTSDTSSHSDSPPPRQISIPAEYSAIFSPDIVLGASLLLTFQHSAH